MSNWLYLIAETIADARNGRDEPVERPLWKSPFSAESFGRSLVGLKTPQDSLAQRGVRRVLHELFKRDR
ncbi:MAG: hypothetical protein Q8R44_17165 [Novosphingobium sp.]|nr:hypothetical protein [Novosphingobium sp.]